MSSTAKTLEDTDLFCVEPHDVLRYVMGGHHKAVASALGLSLQSIYAWTNGSERSPLDRLDLIRRTLIRRGVERARVAMLAAWSAARNGDLVLPARPRGDGDSILTRVGDHSQAAGTLGAVVPHALDDGVVDDDERRIVTQHALASMTRVYDLVDLVLTHPRQE